MNKTDNLELYKPDYSDPADIAALNDNMDILDAAVSKKADSLHNHDYLPYAVSNIENLNIMVAAGNFYITNATINIPSENSVSKGYLIVMKTDTSGVRQLWYPNGTNEIFERHYNNKIWSEWENKGTTENILQEAFSVTNPSTKRSLNIPEKSLYETIQDIYYRILGITGYTHPTTSGNKHIPVGGSLNQLLKWASDGTAKWASLQPLTLEINGDEEAVYDGSAARSLNITPKKIGSVPDYGVVRDVNDYVNTNEYCIIRWNINTLNSPYKDGITKLSSGLIIVSGTDGDTTMLGIPSGSNEIYIKSFADGFDKEPMSDWTKIYPDKDVLRNYGSDVDVTNVNFDTLNEANYIYNVHNLDEGIMHGSLNQPNKYYGYGTLLSFFAEPYSKTQIYIPSLHSQWMMGLAVRTKYGEGEYTKWQQIPVCFFDEEQGYRAINLNGARPDSEFPINSAKGYYSLTAGLAAAADNYASCSLGKFNREMTGGGSWGNTIGDAFVIGNGTAESARSNAFRVTYKGEAYGLSAFNTSGADYAEFIREWFDGNPDNEDRVGYFVTVKGDYLHFANDGDYIAGITSGNPSVVGNADEDYYWRYERDEFNRIVYEDVEEVIQKTGENGNMITVKTGNIIPNARMKLSENYDSERQKDYVERKNRPEWDYVGMVGVLPVRDDGTCEPDGFCKCGKNGMATKADTRTFDTFRVIGRINENVISVILK